jgi:hypothetical protein
MTERTFRRYTNLASALHILRDGCITLLSPETWDDRNDAYFMAEYKRLKKAKIPRNDPQWCLPLTHEASRTTALGTCWRGSTTKCFRRPIGTLKK